MDSSGDLTDGPRDAITIEPYQAAFAPAWKSFLATSDNGTLFHDLDFLAYQPKGRFDEHHLIFSRGDETLALLPAAVVAGPDGRRWVKSPYGASVGGFILPQGQSPIGTLELCASIQDYARSRGYDGIEMRIAPGVYNRAGGEALGFALAATGFTLTQRRLCMVIPLAAMPEAEMGMTVSSRYRQYVRAALRQGAEVAATGLDRLDEIYRVLEVNRAKHKATPTHSLEELRWLVARMPDRIRPFMCTLDGAVIGAAIMFDLTDRLTNCFYLCHDEQFEQYRAPAVIMFHVIQEYARRGFRHIDMGPSGEIDLSSRRRTMNPGGSNFKQHLGAVAFCRDTWCWESGQ